MNSKVVHAMKYGAQQKERQVVYKDKLYYLFYAWSIRH